MGIFGSVSRYLRTYGRLLYADPRGFGRSLPQRRRDKKGGVRSAYLDALEPRPGGASMNSRNRSPC